MFNSVACGLNTTLLQSNGYNRVNDISCSSVDGFNDKDVLYLILSGSSKAICAILLPVTLNKKVVDIIQNFSENAAITYCKANQSNFYKSAGELW